MAKAVSTFTWQGKDRHGQSKKGEITAATISEAKNLLRRQGISANKVKNVDIMGQKQTTFLNVIL